MSSREPAHFSVVQQNSKIITIESDDEKPSHHELIPILHSDQECSNSLNSDMENLCPTWQGEYNDISHLNTCSKDNIISLISLSQEMIENARKLSGISFSPDAEQFISLIYRRQFDELRDFVARLLDLSVTYYVVVPKVDFYGSESKIIELLRKFNISNHLYSVTLQCYNCCASFTNVTQIGSITEVASTLQESINNKMRYKKCKKCDSTGSNLEILSGTFNAIPSILAVELGHVPETSCTIRTKDIEEFIYISENTKTLTYKLVGYTLSLGNHFYMQIQLNSVWYKYDDLYFPKLTECQRDNTSIGKLNTVFYVLDEELTL